MPAVCVRRAKRLSKSVVREGIAFLFSLVAGFVIRELLHKTQDVAESRRLVRCLLLAPRTKDAHV